MKIICDSEKQATCVKKHLQYDICPTGFGFKRPSTCRAYRYEDNSDYEWWDHAECVECWKEAGVIIEVKENTPRLYSDEDLMSHPFD